MDALLLRDARQEDLPQIVSIYNRAIPGRLATADLHPVTVESRLAWFDAHHPRKYPLIVAEDPQQKMVLGWGCLSQFYGRIAYQHTAEIAIYVLPTQARKGIGLALADELIRRCPQLLIRTILAFVFAHNEPSIRLFQKKGFARWGHLPRIADMDGVERDLDIYGRRIEIH